MITTLDCNIDSAESYQNICILGNDLYIIHTHMEYLQQPQTHVDRILKGSIVFKFAFSIILLQRLMSICIPTL